VIGIKLDFHKKFHTYYEMQLYKNCIEMMARRIWAFETDFIREKLPAKD
jgi:hypothetical protein